MATPPQTKRKVLFVDDEPAFLETIGQAMRSYSRGGWDIELAPNTSKALGILAQGPVHLVVVDIQMPVVDGIQFLKLLQRKYPNIPKAVLTGHATDEHRAACQSNGVEMLLEKPRSKEGLEIVYATLDELAKWQPQTGFHGVLRQVGLQDVLQMECLARSSVVLEIAANGLVGRIFIEQGSIIHSHVSNLKGEAAFNHLLGLSGGQFNLKPFVEPTERTISGSWEFLLMEAARMKDEILHGGGETAEAATPAPSPAEVLPGLMSNSDTSYGTESFALDTLPPEPTPPVAPKIEEFLITTSRGEVIHEWQCEDPAVRSQFIDFVRQKSRQVCQGLPVGALERLELEGLDARMIVRIEAEQTFLLRVTREKPGVQVEPSHA